MKHTAMALAVAALIAGCTAQEESTFLRLETADASYTKIEVPFNTSIMGNIRVPVYTRLFEHDGKTAICGYFINPGTGCDATVIEEWFKQAQISLDKQPIGSGRYMMSSAPNNGAYQARCVATHLPWQGKYSSGQWLDAKGGRVTVRC